MNIVFIYLLIPWLISFVVAAVIIIFGVTLPAEKLEKILDSTITFSSILLGFLSTSLGILITIRNSPIMKKIYELKYRNVLKYYFFEAISSGFIIIVVSIFQHLTNWGDRYVFGIWAFFVTLFIISSYRLIATLMDIMFKTDLDEDDNIQSSSNNPNRRDRVDKSLMINREKKESRPKNQKIDPD